MDLLSQPDQVEHNPQRHHIAPAAIRLTGDSSRLPSSRRQEEIMKSWKTYSEAPTSPAIVADRARQLRGMAAFHHRAALAFEACGLDDDAAAARLLERATRFELAAIEGEAGDAGA